MMDIRIDVLPGVYPPSEDSYLLADVVGSMDLRGKSFLEVGCGSGIVAITAAVMGADVTAVDVNPAAVRCTLHNAERNGVRVKAFVSDLFENVRGRYDVIAFNPPYLPGSPGDPDYDPAWSGGENGREVTERFLGGVGEHLRPCGAILLVQSSLSGAEETVESLERSGYLVEIAARSRFFMETLYVLRAVKPCP